MRYRYSKENWQKAKNEALSELKRRSKLVKPTIFYSELSVKIKSIEIAPDSQAFADLLGELSKENLVNCKGMISALVVSKFGENKGMPGKGFFSLAEELERC